MTAQELRHIGQRCFQARQYTEALPLLKSATEAFPTDESLWLELVLSASWTGQHAQAVEFAKQGTRQHPRSDRLLRQLGSELTALDRLDEAENALNNARSLNPKADWLWRYLAALHRKQHKLENEIEALEHLHALGAANSTDLNLLGVAYHNHKNLAKALKYYRLAAATGSEPWPLFNMGLVFNDPDLSQEADAADAYRRALALNPNNPRAKEQLEATQRRLVPLADQARTAAIGLLPPDDSFQFYVSPFEALQLPETTAGNDLDVQALQGAKKRLVQAIQLNDGRVS